MERFLIVVLGVAAVIPALILASQWRARRQPGADEPPAKIEKRSNAAAIALAGVAFLLVVAAAGFAGMSFLEWRAIDGQLRQTAEHRRAWVYATPTLSGPMIIKGHEVSLPVRYRLENTGEEPAVDTRIASAIVPEAASDIAFLQRSLCARLRAETDAAAGRNSVFPKQSLDIIRVEDTGADIVNGQLSKQARADLPFWWIGCVDYKSFGKPEHHQTAFIYEIAELGAGPQGFVRISLTDRTVPKDRLVIVPYLRGGFYAD